MCGHSSCRLPCLPRYLCNQTCNPNRPAPSVPLTITEPQAWLCRNLLSVSLHTLPNGHFPHVCVPVSLLSSLLACLACLVWVHTDQARLSARLKKTDVPGSNTDSCLGPGCRANLRRPYLLFRVRAMIIHGIHQRPTTGCYRTACHNFTLSTIQKHNTSIFSCCSTSFIVSMVYSQKPAGVPAWSRQLELPSSTPSTCASGL
ncbi:hypothetical protein B0I35DRAFT_205198 [Stachybotrys elegans]|uniref:Uncharacterized protein n=1 Tax=Stachybotrys elegans TaxID=80388 RepID=A0A8K0SYB1_9HYPO|nr:hypothetical protein B0I35DRAFT_205198 [Stachybotrys elegans]